MPDAGALPLSLTTVHAGGSGHGHGHGHEARIGPNAIIRLLEVLQLGPGPAVAERLFRAAGLERYLRQPPAAMVPEEEVTLLHHVLAEELGHVVAGRIAREAGRRTGDYLLAHRIPKPAQAVLKLLPEGLASRLLLKAVGKHSWTFAGSGTFTVHSASPAVVSISGCPLCKGMEATEAICDFYTGTFERLFQVLVHPGTVVVETECAAMGADRCTFEMRW